MIVLPAELIQARLARLEAEHGVKVIHAVESGSRVWGFQSHDSDYDVRFIYVRPIAWYMSVRLRRDVIEPPLDGLLDFSGWDLRKALYLLSKSNPPLMEWLTSPIVYRTSPVAQQLCSLGRQYFNPRSAIYHYFHMADGNYRTYLQSESVRLKKYLYVLRPILCCRHIERTHSMPPVVFDHMVAAEHGIPVTEISALLEAKKAGAEIEEGPRVEALNAFIDSELARLSKLARVSPSPKLTMDDLDEFFHYAVGGMRR